MAKEGLSHELWDQNSSQQTSLLHSPIPWLFPVKPRPFIQVQNRLPHLPSNVWFYFSANHVSETFTCSWWGLSLSIRSTEHLSKMVDLQGCCAHREHFTPPASACVSCCAHALDLPLPYPGVSPSCITSTQSTSKWFSWVLDEAISIALVNMKATGEHRIVASVSHMSLAESQRSLLFKLLIPLCPPPHPSGAFILISSQSLRILSLHSWVKQWMTLIWGQNI